MGSTNHGVEQQSSNALGGFKAQGLTADTAKDLIEDARLVYEAGAFSILIEAVPPEVRCLLSRYWRVRSSGSALPNSNGCEADGWSWAKRGRRHSIPKVFTPFESM
ncbi:MAG: 3-methyl-2-oxobutanoate hydroxymethyltransferase [Deltaproteobacteria bacterium]|nr:3-methyl-2-oxobutanoate hydroxymethyltransferase [Deltaproteobacteria bacterium]